MQHPNMQAARARAASGTPMPMPIFALRVRPEELDAGATGSDDALGVVLEVVLGVALEVGLGVEEANVDVEKVVADEVVSSDDDSRNVDLKVWLDDAVGVILLELSDTDTDDCDSRTEDAVLDACEMLVGVVVGLPVTDAVTSVGNGPVAGGAAVAGPNSLIK